MMLSLLFFLSLLSLPAEAQTISQTVGQAGDRVVTSREVQINYFIETTLFPEEKSQSVKTDILDKNFEKQTTHVLIEWIVFKEADVFNASGVPEEDIAKSIAIVKSVAGTPELKSYWEGLAPTFQELRDMVTRKLRAKKFIQFKTKASVVPVTDAEALQYFQKNRIRFGNAPFAQFKDSIKSLLAQDQANTRIRDWFELLQKKYRVRKVAVK